MSNIMVRSGQMIVPKNQRSKRALQERAPKLVENVKRSIVLKGPKASQVISQVLRDLHKLKAPDSKMMQKRNLTRPFEDATSIEFLSQANDCSLFSYGSHSKKRNHNLVIGRLFDYQLLDMYEFGVDPKTYRSMAHFEGKRKALLRYGSKPMFVFNGELFDTEPDYIALKGLLLDYFRGEVMPKINLASLDRMISVTAHKGKVYFRQYGVLLKKSGTKFPRVELEEAGPSLDLTVRRIRSADPGLLKESMRKPRTRGSEKKADRKNIEKDEFGQKTGRLHLHKQDFKKVAISKLKGLKKRKTPKTQVDEAGQKRNKRE